MTPRLALTGAGSETLPYWQNKAARDYAEYSGKAVRGRTLWDTIAAVESRLRGPVEEFRQRSGQRIGMRRARILITRRLLPNLEIPDSWRDGDSGMILAIAIQLHAMSDAEIIAALTDNPDANAARRRGPLGAPAPE